MPASDPSSPPSHDHSITRLLDRFQEGDSVAIEQLYERYIDRLQRLGKRKLGAHARRVADEEDLAVSAFHEFIRSARKDRFERLDDRDDLWQILAMIMTRKAIAQLRRYRTLKRGGGLVRGESAWHTGAREDLGLSQLPGPVAEPDLAAMAQEEFEARLAELPDDRFRQIAIGKLQGQTNREIADELGIALRSVERKLNLIRHRWEKNR